MTLLYYDPVFLEHDTGSHPECAARLRAVAERLAASDVESQCERPTWQPAAAERLLRVHEQGYIDDVRQFARQGGGPIEVDTVVSPRSYDVALQAAGAVCDAVERVVRGPQRRALCLVRPPGHHSLAGAPMGFCLFNNIAIGARTATRELDLDRVLIVDWDVHHGNGTQATFWTDPQVGFLSIHRFPFYPGTGDEDERGEGDGLGTIVNLPVAYGTPTAQWHARLENALHDLAGKMQPELILISAGFDAHRADPVGSLGLDSDDFVTATKLLLDAADAHCEGRVVSVLEGGYNPPVLAECIELHLRELLARDEA